MTTTNDRDAGSGPEPAEPEFDDPPRPTGVLNEMGLIVRFIGTTFREFPQTLAFPSEILRQAATIILSSTFVIWGFLLVNGVLVAQIGFYLLGQLGAQSYVGLFAAAGTLKGSSPILFGYIVAAKIGCGFAAELGSMRINEEIDAMRVMGIPAGPYLVGTRVLGFLIAAPFLWLSGIAICFFAAYVVDVPILNAVSPGGYSDVFWSFTTPTDVIVRSLVWAIIPLIFVVNIACYFGYTVSGGPVDVGDNTAKSMVTNVVLISVFGAGTLFQLFYGSTVILPIGN